MKRGDTKPNREQIVRATVRKGLLNSLPLQRYPRHTHCASLAYHGIEREKTKGFFCKVLEKTEGEPFSLSYGVSTTIVGRNGRSMLRKSLKDWELDYTEKKSITSNDSFLLNINKIKKKNNKIVKKN